MKHEPVSNEFAARLFRSRVLQPAEGVFLFHPRAMERLIDDHLGSTGYEGRLPDLHYYLMPCRNFLRALETENPEALAVIEGLQLPASVILLPIPPEQRLDQSGFTRLLREYWARRFEAEIARAWQNARDTNQDQLQFGAAALIQRIGGVAFDEVRDVLTHDRMLPAGVGDELVCRSFVAFLTRLRHFSPGVRAFLFPAIRDWALVDRWCEGGGLGKGPDGTSLPVALLAHTRPDPCCGEPARLLPVPRHFAHGAADTDAQSFYVAHQPAVEPTNASAPVTPHLHPRLLERTRLRCLQALQQNFPLQLQGWSLRLGDLLLRLSAPLWHLLFLLLLMLCRTKQPPALIELAVLGVFRLRFTHAVRMARRTESAGLYARALCNLHGARQLCARIGSDDTVETRAILRILHQRQTRIRAKFSAALASAWQLPEHEARELHHLIERLDHGEQAGDRALLRDLARILHESRATYYRLRPLAWLRSGMRQPLRQILPFQAHLKTLRLLELALHRLDDMDWSEREIERLGQPLHSLIRLLHLRLEWQLTPLLQDTMNQAGFRPGEHFEHVAAHKMVQELLDVIQRRRHLKFTDLRDIVARNALRLPDTDLREWLRGDRLARFDHLASRALPGLYKPGEIYIKGLQQFSAPLFGTPVGRLVLRHLLLPFGVVFLTLKTIDLLTAMFVHIPVHLHLTQSWLVITLALAMNVLAYTRPGRLGLRIGLRLLWSAIRLLLYDGVRRFLRWAPVVRLFETRWMRLLNRQLLRPLLIAALLLIPCVVLNRTVSWIHIDFDWALYTLAFTLGTLAHNTPLGRRMVDDLNSSFSQFLRRINQTLILGAVHALLEFFKEVTRRFQQGLHRIEELLSHHLAESRLSLLLKALLVPFWDLCQGFIQFYVTVLVEPQINPIKHFPLVTISHKLLLPFLPWITTTMVGVLEPLLPKWIAYPFVTLTILLLPGLAGFLVWELKENWKIYALNHPLLEAAVDSGRDLRAIRRRPRERPPLPIEPGVVGTHGERLHTFLHRGFHSGTMPKAFDRLRRVLLRQIREERPAPRALREARRHLAEVERELCVFCDRELAHALRLRAQEHSCAITQVETARLRLSTTSFELTIALHVPSIAAENPIELHLRMYLLEEGVALTLTTRGPVTALSGECWELIGEDLRVFAGRTQVVPEHCELRLPQ